MEEEYELIPMSPIRRIEKRLERVERSGTGTDLVKELIEVVRTNQHVVDDIVKINSDLITKVSDLSASVRDMSKRIEEFMGRLEVSGQGAAETEGTDKTAERLDKMEKKINSLVLSAIARSRVAKPVQSPAMMR